MLSLVSKLASVIVAITYVVLLVVDEHGLTRDVAVLGMILVVPLTLIWFPDEVGSFTGSVGRGGNIDAESPPELVSFMGWFLLVGFPAILYAVGGGR
jgi:hypothetical protein